MTDAAPGSPPPAGDLDHASTLSSAPGGSPTAVDQQASAAPVPSAVSATSAPSAESTSTSPVGIPVIGVAPMAEPTPASGPAAPRSTTLLVDTTAHRLRRTEDLLDLTLTLLGIFAVLVLAIYAHETTTGVTQDVQNALAVVLRRILVFPLQTIEGLATFIVPLAVLLDRVLRRSWRSLGQAVLSGIAGHLVAVAAMTGLVAWGPTALVMGLTVTASGTAQLGISTVFASMAGLLTGAGDRNSSTVMRSGWAALWVVLGMAVLRGALTLPGAVLSLLLGRTVGLLVRYVFGVEDRRAHGVTLVRALRRAGIDAVRVVRMDRAPEARAWIVTTDAPLGYTEQVREQVREQVSENPLGPAPQEPTGLEPTTEDASTPADAQVTDAPTGSSSGETASPLDSTPLDTAGTGGTGAPAGANTIRPATDVDLAAVLAEASSEALSQERASVHRMYAVWDSAGERHNVTLLDADRQVAGFLSNVWDQIRVRGLSPTRDLSLRPAAEHAALMTMEARRARVRTPGLLGMAEAAESVLLVTDHVVGARSISDLGAEVDDDVLDQLWSQLQRAHAAGLAHGSIDASSVVVDESGRLWLLDWASGETISTELSRRVDLAQALALTALAVGAQRAIDAASRSLTTAQLASIAPMLQRVVLPRQTREVMGRRGASRQVLQDLRDALVALTPTADAEPARLNRFSTRTVLMAVVALVAVWTLLAQLDFQQVSTAVSQANVWWMLAALVFSVAHAGGLQPRAALPVALHRGAPGQRRRLARGPGRRGRGGHQPALPQPQGGAHRGRRGHSGPGPGGPVRRHRGAARGAGGHDRPVDRTDPAIRLGAGRRWRHRRGGGGGPDHPQGAHLGLGQDRAHLPPGVATARVGHVQPDATGPGRGRCAHAEPVLHPVLQREPVGLRLHGALRGPGHHLPGLQHSGLDRALPRRYRAGRARPDRRARRRRRPLRGGAVHGDRLPPGDLLDPDPGGLAQSPAPPEGRRPVARVNGQGPVMKVPSMRAGHARAQAPTR